LLKEWLLQPLIHNVAILKVVVAEDRLTNDQAEQERATHHQQDDVAHRVVQQAGTDNLDFDCQISNSAAALDGFRVRRVL
jgi:hypothetical protein